MSRAISFSEIQTAMSCMAQWDYTYGGRLAGSTLKRRQIAPILSDGRAWGAAVAAWHGHQRDETLMGVYEPLQAKLAAHAALRASYEQDVLEQAERGFSVNVETEVEALDRLHQVLDHHMATSQRLDNLTRLEDEIDVPIPSRTGRRGSSRYRFHAFIDGWTVDHRGAWLVEFKLRGSLSPHEIIQLGRQIRWYAWALQQMKGITPVGVLMDERLNEAPKPARIVKGHKKDTFRPSHSADQMTTPELYLQLCEEMGEEHSRETLANLERRRWQQRVPILFRPGEIEEAGKELVSAAKLIRDLDSGELWPIRNAKPQLCRSCQFFKICPTPGDGLYVETIYERTIPKRLKPARSADVADSSPNNGESTTPDPAMDSACSPEPAVQSI